MTIRGNVMIVELDRGTSPAGAPMARTIARLREQNHYLQVHLGAPAGVPVWAVPMLCDPEQDVIGDHFAIMIEKYEMDVPEVLVRFYFGGFTYAVASVMVAAYALERRVPILDRNTLGVTLGEWGAPEAVVLPDNRFWCLPDDPDAGHADAHPVADEQALRDRVREGFAHLCEPLIAVLRKRGRIGARALWIAAAERCAGTIVDVLPLDAPLIPAQVEVQALVGDPHSPLRANPEISAIQAGDHHGLVMFGSDCCTNFKIPGETYCGGCPHRPREEREASLRSWIQERADTLHGVPEEQAVGAGVRWEFLADGAGQGA